MLLRMNSLVYKRDDLLAMQALLVERVREGRM